MSTFEDSYQDGLHDDDAESLGHEQDASVFDIHGITVECRLSTGGKFVISAKAGDDLIHQDRIDPNSQSSRRRLLKSIRERVSGLDDEAINTIDAALMRLRAPAALDLNQADTIVELASKQCDLFHPPGEVDGYATIRREDHQEVHALRSRSFRLWLAGLYYEVTARAATPEALRTAIETLSARAIYDGPEAPVHVRLAWHGEAIWIDLADEKWRQVRVGKNGWCVIDESPVKFVRKPGMLALPEPQHGGSLDELRRFVNCDDLDWRLVVAWLVAAYRPGFPFPVLMVTGEQGSAKSTLCKMLRQLVDPNKAPLRRPPRDERDLAIAARNSWVVCFENVSEIKPWLSDALCVLSTGGGLATRRLYTDDEEELFDARRPILLNGISNVVQRGDLGDRTLTVQMHRIDEAERLPEAVLLQEFERLRPRILGALLDVLSACLGRLPGVKLEGLPRLADFALLIAAAEPALGWEEGSFSKLLHAAREANARNVVEGDPVGEALVEFVSGLTSWQGIGKDLLAKLQRPADSSPKQWPPNAQALSQHLRRLAPELRRIGILLELPGRKDRPRTIRIVNRGVPAAEPPTATQPPAGGGKRSSGSSGSSQPAWEAGSSADDVAQGPSGERREPAPPHSWSHRPDDPGQRPDDVGQQSSGLEAACGAGSDDPDDPDDLARGLGSPPWRVSRPSDRCPCCSGRRWWRTATGPWECQRCHPPAAAGAVAETRADGEGPA